MMMVIRIIINVDVVVAPTLQRPPALPTSILRLALTAFTHPAVHTKERLRYTKWRGGRLKRMVSAKNVVKVLGDRRYAFNTDAREYCVSNTSQLYPEYMRLGSIQLLYSREDDAATLPANSDVGTFMASSAVEQRVL
ncbi:hypothetical protein AK812_SmicGene15703 [Symbiodinium microadriaticum]|uniref:Uncharacterized protein n=1 Tax=Symbiodinium microadriaticum TaxID=2951 RepID=A0A1Q9E2E7_SYMMI|nr:hypothetical protein AK812_SmicGene15703 [Symbiodinium microadriaticum]